MGPTKFFSTVFTNSDFLCDFCHITANITDDLNIFRDVPGPPLLFERAIFLLQ